MKARAAAKMLVSACNWLFDSLVLALFALVPVRRPHPLLLMVRADRIGDMVLWLPSAQRLVDHFRAEGYSVALAVNRPTDQLVAALSGIDRIIAFDRVALRTNPLVRLALLWRISRLGATLAIEPTMAHELTTGDALIRASRAPRRIAWQGNGANDTRLGHALANRAYTELLPNPVSATELERNEEFLDRLGVAALPLERVPLPRRPLDWAAPERYAVLFPGASNPLRQWPTERFAQVAATLAARGLAVVVCGDGADRPLGKRIAAAGGPVIDLTGRTDMAQLCEVLAGARLLVSNETAATHLAAALGVPNICLLGGGHHGLFVPYPPSRLVRLTAPKAMDHPMPCFGCVWECDRPIPNHCAPCLDAITVAEVEAACLELLA